MSQHPRAPPSAPGSSSVQCGFVLSSANTSGPPFFPLLLPSEIQIVWRVWKTTAFPRYSHGPTHIGPMGPIGPIGHRLDRLDHDSPRHKGCDR